MYTTKTIYTIYKTIYIIITILSPPKPNLFNKLLQQ